MTKELTHRSAQIETREFKFPLLIRCATLTLIVLEHGRKRFADQLAGTEKDEFEPHFLAL